KATWANVVPAALARPINSRPLKLDAVRQAQNDGVKAVGQASAMGMILIPPLLWVVAIVAIIRARVARRALIGLGVAVGVLLILGVCAIGWVIIMSEIWYSGDLELVFIPLLAALGLALLIFGVYAWVKRDPAAKTLSILSLGWGALLFLLILASDRGPEPDEGWIMAALLAYLLIPGAYLLYGQGRWWQERRFAGGLSTGIGLLSALPAMLILPALTLLSTSSLRGGAMMQPMASAPMPQGIMDTVVIEEVVMEVEKEVQTEVDQVAAGETTEAPRLRQYFPETLYWNPEVVTDESGFVSLGVPMADSITTWRLTALASTQDGRLGFTTRGIRVFQDFFVDIDLPVSLTQGDEISIPVGVFNYLPEAQEVRLVVEQEAWFELLGQAEQTLTIASNDIEVVYFPIRVTQFGQQGFQITAWGSRMSDAIRRQVRVVPDGKEIRLTDSDWLRESKEVVLDIPASAVPGTPRVEVKIYPGVMAQIIEGLEKILRLPHG
ncbi:MAG: hypothetical protein JXA89_00705, partial [Anaerolineae bacterium]|nr:hypothetical protein [Anaerolineae bacterium]